MKNSQKARVWDLTDYLVSELKMVVKFEYDEITVINRLECVHWHIRFNNNNLIEQLVSVTKQAEASGE